MSFVGKRRSRSALLRYMKRAVRHIATGVVSQRSAQAVEWHIKQLRPAKIVHSWVAESRSRTPIEQWPRGSAIVELAPSVTRWLGAPPLSSGALAPHFRAEALQVYPPLWVARLSGASIGPGKLLAVDGSRLSMGGAAHPRSRYATARGGRLDGTFLSLSSLWSDGYAHWLLDVLPKLDLLSAVNDGEVPILVDGQPTRWQLESLAMYGVGAHRLVPVSNLVSPQWTYVAGPIGTPANCHPHAATYLRSILSTGVPKRRLYVSRRRAARRRVLNENDLLPLLDRYEFEVVETEFMSFREQVELFSSAEVVLAPHGAALANIVFSPPGCSILELMPSSYPQLSYWSLSRLVGLSYDVVPCSEANPSTQDFHVEVRKLEAALECL